MSTKDTESGTAQNRLFTDEELEQMATPTSILLERATDSGASVSLDRVVQRMNDELLAIYDAYVQWIGVLQTYIVEEAGEDEHERALRYATQHACPRFIRAYEGLSPRERVERVAGRLRSSGSTFDVVEESDRVRFELNPWGPIRLWREPRDWQAETPRNRQGNRYEYPCYGAFDEPTDLVSLSEPTDLTHGRADVPCHLAVEVESLERRAIELLGMPVAAIDLPESPTETTVLDVYKDPSAVPETVYQRCGTAKPKSGLPSGTSDRLFTDEELDRLATPLSLQVEAAADAGDDARLEAVAETYDDELVRRKDELGISIAGVLTWIARQLGESHVERVLERTAAVVMEPFIDVIRPLSRKEQISMWAMVFRSHGSTFADGPKAGISEYEDRVVFRGRPLGACGRMWADDDQDEVERISENRIRYPTFGCYEPPTDFHLLREPRGITHMQTEYPIYSAHCHALHEVHAIESFGYPLWVEEHPTHDENGVTRHVHYKDPGDWPESYYEQLEKDKPTTLPENAP